MARSPNLTRGASGLVLGTGLLIGAGVDAMRPTQIWTVFDRPLRDPDQRVTFVVIGAEMTR